MYLLCVFAFQEFDDDEFIKNDDVSTASSIEYAYLFEQEFLIHS